jgi:hypothetical protein
MSRTSTVREGLARFGERTGSSAFSGTFRPASAWFAEETRTLLRIPTKAATYSNRIAATIPI